MVWRLGHLTWHLGWIDLKPGQLVRLVDMGLGKGYHMTIWVWLAGAGTNTIAYITVLFLLLLFFFLVVRKILKLGVTISRPEWSVQPASKSVSMWGKKHLLVVAFCLAISLNYKFFLWTCLLHHLDLSQATDHPFQTAQCNGGGGGWGTVFWCAFCFAVSFIDHFALLRTAPEELVFHFPAKFLSSAVLDCPGTAQDRQMKGDHWSLAGGVAFSLVAVLPWF